MKKSTTNNTNKGHEYSRIKAKPFIILFPRAAWEHIAGALRQVQY